MKKPISWDKDPESTIIALARKLKSYWDSESGADEDDIQETMDELMEAVAELDASDLSPTNLLN